MVALRLLATCVVRLLHGGLLFVEILVAHVRVGWRHHACTTRALVLLLLPKVASISGLVLVVVVALLVLRPLVRPISSLPLLRVVSTCIVWSLLEPLLVTGLCVLAGAGVVLIATFALARVLLLVVSVVGVVALVVFVVIVTRMVVLEPKPVARVHAQVDVQNLFHHPHACLTPEVPTIHVIDFVFFDKFWWQDGVFKKCSFVFSVSRVHVASLNNLVVVSHCFHLVVECFPNDFVSNIFQAFDPVTVALNVVFGSKGEGEVT